MKAVWTRVLVLSILVTGAMVLSALASSANASAASVDGKWVSRISGEGYTQTYSYWGEGTITESFDLELDLSESGGVVSGTWTLYEYGVPETYNVEGTFDGTTFHMTAHFGWDGSGYMTGIYTLTVDGDRMSGTGTYINVGVTIYGTIDLKKDSLFAVGGMAPVVSALSITVAIFAIVIAATPGRAPKTGFKPQTIGVPSPPPMYTPTQQWTTDVPPQPMSGDGTTPVGGAGLQYATPPPAGKPFPPREHFTNVSQEPPRCPVHKDVALTPHYSADMNDPGSWFCPRCKGYPWGRS